MIISNQLARRKWWASLLIVGVLAILLALVAALALRPAEQPYARLPEGAVYCGAESVSGGQLVSRGHSFGDAALRSDAQARNGSFSCYLPASGEVQYGFGFRMNEPEPGAAYKVTVWRQRNTAGAGLLAVKVYGEADAYYQEKIAVGQDDNGWEKLELRFFIPYGKKADSFHAYVWSEGHTEVYFDDLLVERIAPGGEAFRPETLRLYISEEGMEKLRRKREEALKAGILETGDNDWVEARLESDSAGSMEVEVRLKGDWLDHLRGDKWSFRIKMKGAESWRRMRSFSLHTPLARYFLHEWLAHQLWEREGVLTTRYDFVELRLNGLSLGVYAYEEHFEKQLAEYRQRREGPILKFSEDGFWKAIKRQLQHHGFVKGGATHAPMDWQNADVQAFNEKETEADTTLAAAYQQARILMEQYRRGEARPAEVFSLRQLARYYAICDVLNAYHGLIWHNQRFYYNPITGRLEPIGFDGFGNKPEMQYSILGEGALNPYSLVSENVFAALFMDPAFCAAYLKELYRLSSRAYLEPALDSLFPGMAARLSFLQMEFPDYRLTTGEILMQAQYAHSLLLPYEEQSLLAYTRRREGPIRELALRNRHNLPLEVIGYGRNRKKPDVLLDTALLLPATMPRQYWKRLQRDSMIQNFPSLRFLEEAALQNQGGSPFYSLRADAAARYLFFKVPGIDSLFTTTLLNKPPPEGPTNAQQLLRKAQLKTGGPYQIRGERIIFSAGQHLIREDIVLPAGYLVVLEAGTSIDLQNGALFLSFSPVQALGTAEEPIKVFSSDGTGQGFTIMEANAPSFLNHILFEGLRNPKKGNWELTGAVTFYRSQLEAYRCTFRNNQSEDALNLIHSEFKIRQCFFGNTSSDGLDADFCKGEVEDTHFVRTANDGMDFSGSIVNIRRCFLEDNGDKGVSVGEESDVTLFDSSIHGSNIAVASKDLSLLVVRGLQLVDCEQGFVAYQKKPEFGPGKIVVESYEARQVKRLHAISEGSTLQMDGRQIQ